MVELFISFVFALITALILVIFLWFVPIQDFIQIWADEKLYKKYDLTKEEIAFIESMIRPMSLSTNNNKDG